MILSDRQAIELFAELRGMPFSHKSERGNRACDLRAHRICDLMQEREILGISKIWIYSLPGPDGKMQENILAPTEAPFELVDEDYDEKGQLRIPDFFEKKPYNIHVAPLLITAQDRELIFDTYFYEAPPELEQWLDDFKPFEEGSKLGHKITETDYLHFRDTEHPLPPPNSWSRIWQNMKTTAKASMGLNRIESHPIEQPQKALWLSGSSQQRPVPGIPPTDDITVDLD